jgi:hypothetical protein
MYQSVHYMRMRTNHSNVDALVPVVSKHRPPEKQMSAGFRRVSGELRSSSSPRPIPTCDYMTGHFCLVCKNGYSSPVVFCSALRMGILVFLFGRIFKFVV